MLPNPFLQFVFQNDGDGALPRLEVVVLARVARRAVEFGLGCVNIVVPVRFQSVQRAPAKRRERIESLAVGRSGALAARGGQARRVKLLLDGIADPSGPQES